MRGRSKMVAALAAQIGTTAGIMLLIYALISVAARLIYVEDADAPIDTKITNSPLASAAPNRCHVGTRCHSRRKRLVRYRRSRRRHPHHACRRGRLRLGPYRLAPRSAHRVVVASLGRERGQRDRASSERRRTRRRPERHLSLKRFRYFLETRPRHLSSWHDPLAADVRPPQRPRRSYYRLTGIRIRLMIACCRCESLFDKGVVGLARQQVLHDFTRCISWQRFNPKLPVYRHFVVGQVFSDPVAELLGTD